jgi:hypothetical protein
MSACVRAFIIYYLKITLNNKYFNYVNILLTTDTIHLQCKFQMNNCSALIVHQVTIYNRCSKYPRPQSMHARARLFMDYQALSTVVGSLRMV